MNQAAAKAEKRAIRRAFGPAAVAFLSDSEQAIATLAAGLNSVRADLTTLTADYAILKQEALKRDNALLAALAKDVSVVAADVKRLSLRLDAQITFFVQLATEYNAHVKRGFLGRFCWFLFGK
jgi:hypothetical protein